MGSVPVRLLAICAFAAALADCAPAGPGFRVQRDGNIRMTTRPPTRGLGWMPEPARFCQRHGLPFGALVYAIRPDAIFEAHRRCEPPTVWFRCEPAGIESAVDGHDRVFSDVPRDRREILTPVNGPLTDEDVRLAMLLRPPVRCPGE